MGNAPDLPWSAPSATPPAMAADWVQGFAIGDVQIPRPFLLAPMSGVTDTAFRRMVQIASRGSVGMFVTEFISIEGLSRRNMKALTRLAFDPSVERPLAVQLFGADINGMAEAARVAEGAGANIVDINCGCPAPTVVRRGGGARLMQQRDHLARLVESTATAVSVPVTVKIRSGWCPQTVNAVDVARAVERAGARMIAVHGRTRSQLYTGDPDWELVAEVAAAVSVPVVGSGDIADAASALHRLRTSGCAGVMIGRAAVMNPWIFGQIEDVVEGKTARVPDNAERLHLLLAFRDMMRAYIPERAVPGRLKQLLARLTKGIPDGHLLRERVLRARDVEEMFRWITSFFAASDRGDLPAWTRTTRTARERKVASQRSAEPGPRQAEAPSAAGHEAQVCGPGASVAQGGGASERPWLPPP